MCTSSLVWIVSRIGQKPFHFLTALQKQLPRPLCRYKFPVLAPLPPQLNHRFLGTRHRRTTAYHPGANGLVERFHRQLKISADDPLRFEPLILLGIHTSLKEYLGCTSAELVYGGSLRLPGESLMTTVPTLAVTSLG